MASVSYGLNRRADQSPERITVGTLAVTTNDVELRWNNSLTNPLQRREIIDILGAFIRRLEDGRYNDTAAV